MRSTVGRSFRYLPRGTKGGEKGRAETKGSGRSVPLPISQLNVAGRVVGEVGPGEPGREALARALGGEGGCAAACSERARGGRGVGGEGWRGGERGSERGGGQR